MKQTLLLVGNTNTYQLVGTSSNTHLSELLAQQDPLVINSNAHWLVRTTSTATSTCRNYQPSNAHQLVRSTSTVTPTSRNYQPSNAHQSELLLQQRPLANTTSTATPTSQNYQHSNAHQSELLVQQRPLVRTTSTATPTSWNNQDSNDHQQELVVQLHQLVRITITATPTGQNYQHSNGHQSELQVQQRPLARTTSTATPTGRNYKYNNAHQSDLLVQHRTLVETSSTFSFHSIYVKNPNMRRIFAQTNQHVELHSIRCLMQSSCKTFNVYRNITATFIFRHHFEWVVMVTRRVKQSNVCVVKHCKDTYMCKNIFYHDLLFVKSYCVEHGFRE